MDKTLRLYRVAPTHQHPKGLYRAIDGDQQFMLMHFANGSIAITPERLDEISLTAELHGCSVQVMPEAMSTPEKKDGPV